MIRHAEKPEGRYLTLFLGNESSLGVGLITAKRFRPWPDEEVEVELGSSSHTVFHDITEEGTTAYVSAVAIEEHVLYCEGKVQALRAVGADLQKFFVGVVEPGSWDLGIANTHQSYKVFGGSLTISGTQIEQYGEGDICRIEADRKLVLATLVGAAYICYYHA